jgi:tryptophan synthase alpha chain
MNNRIDQLFASKQKNILSIFFTAGYPSLEDTEEIILQLDQSGVDLIEIGFPFSDPLADGPTIQQSNQVAIANGMTVEKLFSQLENIRSKTAIPIILMGYLNPVAQYGESRFIKKCAAVGVDGILIPDMPLGYYEKHFQAHCEEHNVHNVLMITPETSRARVQLIAEKSKGFIYVVSSNSITGAKSAENNATNDYLEQLSSIALSKPKLVGFGIHDNKSFQNVCKWAEGGIIGSAFIRALSENQSASLTQTIDNFIQKIKS